MTLALRKSISQSVPAINGRKTAVGLAFSTSATKLAAEVPHLFDYVEMPFELLVHQPSAIYIKDQIPVVLHCASLSIAGNSAPSQQLVDKLQYWISETQTPWLGEHLAYVRADGVWREIAEHTALLGVNSDLNNLSIEQITDEPFNVGYTVSPQLSEEILKRVTDASAYWRTKLGLPILLENGPVYFEMPGSTMTQSSFIKSLCDEASDQLLLLDLAHLAITCSNAQTNPIDSLHSLPLDRVVEVHLSGTKYESGLQWDDHAEPISELVFALLESLLQVSIPRAVTLEYNWDSAFPCDVLERDISRVRGIISKAEQLSVSL